MLELWVPYRADIRVRQAWLADPEFMSYNVRWDVDFPGYDRVTGCVDWPESQWAAFEDRLRLPAGRSVLLAGSRTPAPADGHERGTGPR